MWFGKHAGDNRHADVHVLPPSAELQEQHPSRLKLTIWTLETKQFLPENTNVFPERETNVF